MSTLTMVSNANAVFLYSQPAQEIQSTQSSVVPVSIPASTFTTTIVPAKRGRGRPRKNPIQNIAILQSSSQDASSQLGLNCSNVDVLSFERGSSSWTTTSDNSNTENYSAIFGLVAFDCCF